MTALFEYLSDRFLGGGHPQTPICWSVEIDYFARTGGGSVSLGDLIGIKSKRLNSTDIYLIVKLLKYKISSIYIRWTTNNQRF